MKKNVNNEMNNHHNAKKYYFQQKEAIEEEKGKNELLGLKRNQTDTKNCDNEANNNAKKKYEELFIVNDKKDMSKVNPFLNNEEKNKDVYNINELNEGFKIMGNIVSTDCLEGKVHSFVFMHDSKKIKIMDKGVFIINFNVLKNNKWLAMGLCDKKIVEENKYVFAGKLTSNGCFIISTNNMMWHSFDKNQRKKIAVPEGITSLQDKNTLFGCKYTPSLTQLEFFVNGKHLVTLYDVKPLKSEYLTPCLIFLKDCSVQTTFDYPN